MPVLLSPIIGRFAPRLDMRKLVTFSFIMYAVCFYWRAYTFKSGMDFGASAWPQFVQGFAVACFFMPLTTITLSGLPPERLAAALRLSNFARTLAGSIGTSITTTLWTQHESLHYAHLTESVTPYNPIAQGSYQQLMAMGMSEKQASAYIAQQITNQGLIISANEIFWAAAGGLSGADDIGVVCATTVYNRGRWWCPLSALAYRLKHNSVGHVYS